jgi:acyl carrier protein
MTTGEFLRALEGQLEVPAGSLKGEDAIRDIGFWDSMAAVLFIALADEKLGVAVSGDQIASSKTINDLTSLLGDRLTDG